MYKYSELVHNTEAAEVVLPILFSIIDKPESVLDVGCGIGTWLHVFKNQGVQEVFGIDGDYVDGEMLSKYIDQNEFQALDLEKSFDLDKKFDLVISLEVAEHLNEYTAHIFVDSICRHSDIILFSAAIPGQGGQNHINEQWPEYWARIFQKHGYVFLDPIRPLIWEDSRVDFWYRQNIFLVVKEEHLLSKRFPVSHKALVHPELLGKLVESYGKQLDILNKRLEIHPLKRWIKLLIS
ncbi:class I SAM-dependent methyltransferase [Negadavirga shengliensis]|uniref:Class I SAM-dependent methyltransferase n=1 Tax=Negadavirga shengliensis TaxID=1389218 RepID=A0ABV9T4H8_9BACT